MVKFLTNSTHEWIGTILGDSYPARVTGKDFFYATPCFFMKMDSSHSGTCQWGLFFIDVCADHYDLH